MVPKPLTKPVGASVKVAQAKGRPMLSWVGKRPLREVRGYPAQLVERFDARGETSGSVDWSDWPERFERGGLLFHGDNKEVLAHLLANGFRGKVDLVYIDPPFDSGADYVRRVQLRGASGTARLDGESYTLREQIQYTDIWANDNYLQFMYERLLLVRELMAPHASIFLHVDTNRGYMLRIPMDGVFGSDTFLNEIVWKRADAHNDPVRFGMIHDTILYYAPRDSRVWNEPKQSLVSAKLETDAHYVWDTAADIPERKADLMAGAYDIEIPAGSTAVAVRITDMLGEEVLVVLPLGG